MSEKLKSCPFCGAEVEVEQDESWYWEYHIYCPNCHIQTQYFENPKDLVKMWNARYGR